MIKVAIFRRLHGSFRATIFVCMTDRKYTFGLGYFSIETGFESGKIEKKLVWITIVFVVVQLVVVIVVA